MTGFDPYRWAIVAAWIPVLLWGGFSIFTIASRHQREGDPMRIACFVTSLPLVGFNLWWLTGIASFAAYRLLLIISVVAGLYTLICMGLYGRGRPPR